MDRRTFLKKTSTGMAALTALPSVPAGLPASEKARIDPEGEVATDGYQAPDWLRYCQPVFLDATTPPYYPHLTSFDARRVVKCVLELGGNTLRFEPITFGAYYPSKAFPMHPELNNRDLIDEVSRECRKASVHLYCYTKYANPFMKLGWVDQHPEYADWVLRGPDGEPYGTLEAGWMILQKPDATGDAYRQVLYQVVRELCEHDIDGVYFDAPSGFDYTDVCYCHVCRKKFRAFSGMDINRLQNPEDLEARIAWYQWFDTMTLADLLEFRKIIHGSGKFMLCHNGVSWVGQALRGQYRVPDGFMLEHSTQIYQRMVHGLMGASMARPSKKVAQIYLGGFCVSHYDQPP
jgi:hypothetical protein